MVLAEVRPANRALVAARLRQVRLEVLLVEAHRAANAQVGQATRAGELVDRRDRKPQQSRDLAGREKLMVKPDGLFAHVLCVL